MAEDPDRQRLLTALTTDHFTLQSARSQTASASASRASLYILAVSSTTSSPCATPRELRSLQLID